MGESAKGHFLCRCPSDPRCDPLPWPLSPSGPTLRHPRPFHRAIVASRDLWTFSCTERPLLCTDLIAAAESNVNSPKSRRRCRNDSRCRHSVCAHPRAPQKAQDAPQGCWTGRRASQWPGQERSDLKRAAPRYSGGVRHRSLPAHRAGALGPGAPSCAPRAGSARWLVRAAAMTGGLSRATAALP